MFIPYIVMTDVLEYPVKEKQIKQLFNIKKWL